MVIVCSPFVRNARAFARTTPAFFAHRRYLHPVDDLVGERVHEHAARSVFANRASGGQRLLAGRMVEPWLHFTSSLWMTRVGLSSRRWPSRKQQVVIGLPGNHGAFAHNDRPVEDAASAPVKHAFVELETLAMRRGVVDEGVIVDAGSRSGKQTVEHDAGPSLIKEAASSLRTSHRR